MTIYTYPHKLNLAPGAVLNDGTVVDLTIYCGSDWALSVPFVDTDGVTPINVSSPKMQIRAAEDVTSDLLLSPTLTPSLNTVAISILGTASKLVTVTRGSYDLYVTRVDTGAVVKLLTGLVQFSLPTTAL